MAMLGSVRILGELKRGALAEVYLASAQGVPGGGELVVIKRVRNLDPGHIAAALEQARVAGRLHHPNIVQTYDVRQENGSLFVVMEYLHGPTLRELRRADLPHVPWAIELDIACNVLDGLHYAHELRDVDRRPLEVVHRDLSPENVIVTERGDTKILDFGIAQARDTGGPAQAGHSKGKVGSLAPELVRGEEADGRADVYAAGVMLCEGLLGHSLWGELSNAEIAARLARGEVPSLDDVGSALPKSLREICARATDARPENRYGTALELRSALLAYAQENDLFLPRAKIAAYVEGMFAEGRARIERMMARMPKRERQPVHVPDAAADSPQEHAGAADAQPSLGPSTATKTATEVATASVQPAPETAPAPPEAIPVTAPASESRPIVSTPPSPARRPRRGFVVMAVAALVPIAFYVLTRWNLVPTGWNFGLSPSAPALAPPAPLPVPASTHAQSAEPPPSAPGATAEAAEPPGAGTSPSAEAAEPPVAVPSPAAALAQPVPDLSPTGTRGVAAAEPSAAVPSQPTHTTSSAPVRNKVAAIRQRKPARVPGPASPAPQPPPVAAGAPVTEPPRSTAPVTEPPRSTAPVTEPRSGNGRALDVDSPYSGSPAAAPPPVRSGRNIDRANPFGEPK